MQTDYLIAYDSSCSNTRNKLQNYISAFAINQQKSVYICALTQAEKSRVKKRLLQLIHNDSNSLVIFIAITKENAVCMGQTNRWLQPTYMLGYAN